MLSLPAPTKGGKGDRHDDRSADRPNSGRDDHRGNQWWEEDWHKGSFVAVGFHWFCRILDGDGST